MLRAGDWIADVLPEVGGSIVRLDWRGQPVFRRSPVEPNGPLQTGCFPLVPYANRIDHGRFAWNARVVVLDPTPGFAPHALHGIGWRRAWTVTEANSASVTLSLVMPAGDWPWAWRAEQIVTLDETGLRIVLSLTNADETPMPGGAGLHPYFATQTGDCVRLAAPSVWVAPQLIPERLEAASVVRDWSDGVQRADAPFVDHAYEDWHGVAELIGVDRTVTMTSAASRLHVYAPPGEDFICLEPVTDRPDALNAPPGEASGIRVLAPGETMRLSMRVTAQAAQ